MWLGYVRKQAQRSRCYSVFDVIDLNSFQIAELIWAGKAAWRVHD
jgi:hypothetical protein